MGARRSKTDRAGKREGPEEEETGETGDEGMGMGIGIEGMGVELGVRCWVFERA